jgi:hypothetical protein
MAKNIKQVSRIKFDQYLFTCIDQYPTLYGASSFDVSKMKCADQFFNVLGNGIRDDEELIEDISRTKKKLKRTNIEKYVSGNGVWYGYTEANVTREKIGEGDDVYEIVWPKGDPEGFYLTDAAEKVNHPEIVKWIFSEHHGFTPYPNFSEQYSTIYQCPAFFELDVSWLEAALWFYQECQKWFNGNNANSYHSAFPTMNQKDDDHRIKELQTFLKDPRYKTNADISEAYACEFVGSVDNYQDVYDFQVRRWAKEYARIEEFLTKTIAMIENKLKDRANDATGSRGE